MKILITGASGFIGKALIKKLSDQGHIVGSLDRQKDNTELKGEAYDCLIHLAGRAHVLNEIAKDAYQAFKEANVDFTLKIAKLAKELKIKKFIFISSIGVNGNQSFNHAFTEADTPNPHSFYAKTKWEAELALKAIFSNSDTKLTIIRPPLVYGPYPKGNFKTLWSICRYPLPLPFGMTNNERSMISIDNLCNFIGLCCTHPAASDQTFLISDDHDISLTELVSTIRKTLGRHPCLLPIPSSILKTLFTLIGKSSLNEQLLGNLRIDTSKAKSLLDWKPTISFEEGIKRVVKKNVV